ncbi:MAG: ribosome rescue protein RqcH [Candidatus Nanoarchaeia archaeon]|jgi:predicted ribosome quality control (RQC) complex YloA/Tae2 family protein
MKNVLSGIDLISVVRELTCLKGAFIEKIYQVGDELLFHLKLGSDKHVLRVVVGKLIHLSKYIKDNPMMPTNFCMYLRKYLKGARLVSVNQPGLERIVVLRLSRGGEFFKLFFELFSTGNVIITDDADIIKQPLKFQRFSSRTIRPGVIYSFPPSNFDLSNPDLVTFKRVIKLSDKPDLVRSLAVNIGLGGSYAEEACLLAGADKLLVPDSVNDELLNNCFNAVIELIKRAKYLPIEPRVILVGERVVDATPFALKFYANSICKEFPSFNEALDFFYARSERLSFDEQKDKLVSGRQSKLEARLAQQKAYVDELKRNSAVIKERALVLKDNLYLVERVINSLLNARRSNYSWHDITAMIDREKEAGSSEAQLISELRPDDNLIIIDLAGGIEVPLSGDFRGFMDDLFEKSKKLESKVDGAMEAVERAQVELNAFNPDEVKLDVVVPKRSDSSGHEWFERFKWFRASDGSLVIAGRNAQQNEELVAKYVEPDDLVFHADIHGSPFTVLRNGRKVVDTVRLEAAAFTAAHSSAWAQGVAIDVYFVLPYQVTKDAPSGEYLRPGGFMIKGHKEFVKSLKPELCLGVELLGELSYRLVSGPASAVKAHSKVCVTLEPGSSDEPAIIHQLVDFFKSKGYSFGFETIKASLPSGGSRIVSTF